MWRRGRGGHERKMNEGGRGVSHRTKSEEEEEKEEEVMRGRRERS